MAKQLLHRNEERKLLYEKIKIQQSILSKGDFHYKERMEDIHLLKLEIKRLQRKKSILDKTVPNTEDLRSTTELHSHSENEKKKKHSGCIQ